MTSSIFSPEHLEPELRFAWVCIISFLGTLGWLGESLDHQCPRSAKRGNPSLKTLPGAPCPQLLKCHKWKPAVPSSGVRGSECEVTTQAYSSGCSRAGTAELWARALSVKLCHLSPNSAPLPSNLHLDYSLPLFCTFSSHREPGLSLLSLVPVKFF